MEANNHHVVVHFELDVQHYANGEVQAHWRLLEDRIVLTMVWVRDTCPFAVEAVATILVSWTHPYGVACQFTIRYLRERLDQELQGVNVENFKNSAQVAPHFVEFMMPEAEVMAELEWQEQNHED